jgi:hypothetical protein
MLKVLALLAGVLSLLAAAFAAATGLAVPCGPTTCAQVSSAAPGSRVLLVRPQGQAGPLVAYDLATGRVRTRLAAGVLSANGRSFSTARNGIDSTIVTRYDPTTGGRLSSTKVAGSGLELGAVSSDGRYVALVDGSKNPTVSIVDLSTSTVARKISLDGEWAVDALSRDGRRLYLIQYKTGGRYNVRVHEAGRGLVEGAITDPDEPEPMTGMPWASIGSPDGSRQLTLYLKSSANETEPFVHSLSLTSEQAACIDLPGGDFMSAGRYTLVLARDLRTLYAANPSLGVVVTIDLQSRAASIARFARTAADNRTSAAFGALSPDGNTLVFTGGRGVMAYDVAARKARGPYAAGAVAGLGFAPSGRTVLVVRADGSTRRLDARTGVKLGA